MNSNNSSWMKFMYKVVIIDDEPIIVEGLSRGVNWDAFHCLVAGTAGSGEDGLRLIRKVKPHIVFSDIRMPCMDGLTMIAAMKSEFPGTQIAILTGYRDFDYAQKAIRLGVSRFLLKPSKMDEIEEALRAMTKKLDESGWKYEQQYEPEHGQEHGQKETYPEGNGQACEGYAEDAGSGPGPILGEKLPEMEENLPESAASSYIVKNAVSYIEEHYKDKLKLSDVADQVYVSQWHLSKLMNRYLGQNFSEILNGVRISQAKELLKDPALRIGDIADEVGFLDVAHFSRVFKKTVGISANEYRNQM